MKTLELQQLHFSRLHNAEFGQFIIRFYEDFEKSELRTDYDADFEAMYEKLKAKIPAYNKAVEQIKAQEESKKIQELDADRDSALQSLKDSLKPYRKSKIAEEQQAYNALRILLDQYKEVQNNAFEEETNKLNSLIAALESAEYADKVSVLAVSKFIANLKASNTAFNDLFAHRSFAVSQKETYDVKLLRKDLLTDYKKMANYILALASVKEDEFYKKTLELLNNSRKYFADVLARRITPKDDKPTDEKPL